jgi:hypothetical protein
MGRTVPSFRNVFEMEKAEWKLFRNALDKSERKEFDDMFYIARLYLTACSNSVSLVPFHPIVISILFHHYRELVECRKQVEQINNISRISSRTTTSKVKDLQNETKASEEEEEKEEEEEGGENW